MPIIERADDSSPLTQGDVLSGVPLFTTDINNQPEKSNGDYCLVLSRPCVVARKPAVTVVRVKKFTVNLPRDVESFRDFLDFLTDMRDGANTPDVFYLGHIPDVDGIRFGARLDEVHTIQLPDDRRLFLTSSRVGKLNLEFARDLHLRLFRAFASLGFDDHAWFSNEDLTLLMTMGDRDIRKLEADMADELANSEKQKLRGHTIKEKKLGELEKELSALKQNIQPYRDELAKRAANKRS
jgi:hypothetical protein